MLSREPDLLYITGMKWLILALGVALIILGPSLGERLQCLAIVFPAIDHVFSTVICEPPVWVDFKYTAPFEILGGLLCFLALRRFRMLGEEKPD